MKKLGWNLRFLEKENGEHVLQYRAAHGQVDGLLGHWESWEDVPIVSVRKKESLPANANGVF